MPSSRSAINSRARSKDDNVHVHNGKRGLTRLSARQHAECGAFRRQLA
jgi:hypothetical protein